MKIGSVHYRFWAILVLFSLSTSCSNEVDLHTSGDHIPIVYCLLNPLEKSQIVRIGKSFHISKDQPNNPPVADSLVWLENTEVYIERWENDDPVETILFEEITNIRKDTGYFPGEALKIYGADFQPKPGENYHLFVYFPELNKIVSGQTLVMSVPEILDPELVPGRMVSFDTISPYKIRWRGGTFTGLYQGVFKMNYTESGSGDLEHKSCYFKTPIYKEQRANDLYEEYLTAWTFLKAVASQIDPIPGVERELISFEFRFYAAGIDLAILVDNDLTGGNPFVLIQNNSNIFGGMGAFSSFTYQRIPNLQASETTKYFLATSTITRNLGFKHKGE